jgi:hypothetical protein
MRDGRRLVYLERTVIAIAAIKIAIGVAAIATTGRLRTGDVPLALFQRELRVIAFGLAGALLLATAKRDSRARLLGICFALVGSMSADALVRVHAATATSLHLVERIMAVQADAFLPYFLWRFAREFPRAPHVGRVDRAFRWMIRASAVIGAVLFGANLLFALGIGAYPALASPLVMLSRWPDREIYWPLEFTLSLGGLAALIWSARRGALEERRRGRLLVAALVIGAAPTVTWSLLQAVSTTFAAMLPLSKVWWILYPTLLSIPFTTAYAVLVRKALDVRLVVRRALQYALARYSVLTIATVPVALLLVALYQERDQSVVEILSTPAQLALAVLALFGSLAMRRRGEVLQRLDRRFFREQYDARRILGQLIERCRTVSDTRELAEVFRIQVDRALHLHAVHVLFVDVRSQAFVAVDGRARALPIDPALVAALEQRDGALDVDLEHPTALVRRLGAAAQGWILDTGARLLLPLRGRHRRLIGVVALGEKRSELPFSREDRELLVGVAGAAEMAIAYRELHAPPSTPSESADAERRAAECPRCGAVHPPGHLTCARCAGETIPSLLPHAVAGKFLIDQRVGAGGMGVVYRAMDIDLGRLVAIKTLPHVTPMEAIRLQREARTMASLSHPHLALIFGAEVWQGQPLLVFEYLAGGTLADQLRHGPLGVQRTLELGLAMASVLEALHGRGVLHRDIKPSNIGFTAEGVPKLLDFGLARLMTSMAAGREQVPELAEGERLIIGGSDRAAFTPDSVTDGVIRGTPLYMSPEAREGRSPDPSFDLWSLSVVLYEAVFGRHPFVDRASTTGARISDGSRRSGWSGRSVTLPSTLAVFFVGALSDDAGERPSTAYELAQRLRRVARAGS